ncbi:MAG: hypothetical protein P4L42_06395 [Desulfocapsaceae bacterium]|nr:hypothetical protein [Desulfocapsaceae bacterium]
MYRFIMVLLLFFFLTPMSLLAESEDEGENIDDLWNEYTIMPGDFDHPDAPRFEQFKVPLKFTGKPAPVNLDSHPDAKNWQTMLRAANEKGPNFADHITVATWGCGMACTGIAFIDARDGRVYFADNLTTNVTVNVHNDVMDNTLIFHRDSNLLIAAGCPNEECTTRRGVNYFIWTGTGLKEIFRVPRGWYPE